MRAAVFGVNAVGLAVLAGIPVVLAVAAAVAIYIPARRALKIDPSRPPSRIDALAERANEGILSEIERSEHEALVNVADFISILKRLHLESRIQ